MTYFIWKIGKNIKIILHGVSLILNVYLRVLSKEEERSIVEKLCHYLIRGTLFCRMFFPTILKSNLYELVYRI